MSEDMSRRGFLAGLTVGGTALALDDGERRRRRAAGAPPGGGPAHGGNDQGPGRGEARPRARSRRIRRAGRNVELVVPRDDAETLAAAAEAEVILGEPSAEAIRAARKLKWVQHWAAGVERLPRELMQHPCVLTNMQRVFAPVIAESAFGLLLGLTRGLVQESVPNFRLRKWERGGQRPPRRSLPEDAGRRRPGRDRHRGRAAGPPRLRHEGPGRRPQAHAEARVRRRAARAGLAPRDGPAGGRARELRAPHPRDGEALRRSRVPRPPEDGLLHQRLAGRARRPGGPRASPEGGLDPRGRARRHHPRAPSRRTIRCGIARTW